MLMAAPKWGNDDERARHRWAQELVALRERVLGEVTRTSTAGRTPSATWFAVCITWMASGSARQPTGRRAGAPVADSIGAETAQPGPADRGPE